MDSALQAFFKEKFVGGLNHDPGAVARVVLTAASPAMLHVLQYRQRIGNILMGFISFDAGYKTDPAGIVFK